MNFFERNRRVALGFLEHIGNISIARYRNRTAGVDWSVLMDRWDPGQSDKGTVLRRLDPDVPDLELTYFACHGTLPLHVDMIGRKSLTFGAILHCAEELHLNASEGSVEVEAGTLFMLDPSIRHGAQAEGRFLFATIDLPEHQAPTVEKFRRRVGKDIRRIAQKHGHKETT